MSVSSVSYRGTVTVEVDLDDFSDDDIVAACVSRDLGHHVAAAIEKAAGRKLSKSDAGDHMRDALADLLSRRTDAALRSVHAAIDALLPPGLREAVTAIERGDRSTAICLLDGCLIPSPAATATNADVKRLARQGAVLS